MTYQPPCNREHFCFPITYKDYPTGSKVARGIEYIAWDSTKPTSRPLFLWSWLLYKKGVVYKQKETLTALNNWDLDLCVDDIADPRRYDAWYLDRCARKRAIYQYDKWYDFGFRLQEGEDWSCFAMPPLKPKTIKTYHVYESRTGYTVEYLQATTKKDALEQIKRKYKTQGIGIQAALYE